MAFARRSVKDVDLQAYKDFHANQQKAKQQATGDLPGEKFQWPESSSVLDSDNKQPDDDGLYGSSSLASNTSANNDDDLYG